MKKYLKSIVNDRDLRRYIGDTIRITTLLDIIKRYTDSQGVIPKLLEAGYVQELCPYYYSVTYLPEELDFALEVFYLMAVVDCKLPTNVPMSQKDFRESVWRGCDLLGITQDRKSMWHLFKDSKYFNTGLRGSRISLKSPSALDLKLISGYEVMPKYLYEKFREFRLPLDPVDIT